ncbi:Sphingomyelinase phosphodiesterase D, partial [Paramuricea clavata]
MFNSHPQFTIKAVKHKAFDNSCLVETFKIKSGNIADCLEHCLENCRCQSFQICGETKCRQLCSGHKNENSSLLHDKDDCIYATYEVRDLTESFQKLDDQCLAGISCPMKYNCCQQSGLCPKNKTCKPINSQEQPWKRFTCECRDGYHGENCDQPIMSCQGYAQVLGCRSYSFENRSLDQFKKSLSENLPISENALTWNSYRLSKQRMESVKDNSTFLQFTCDYEKYLDIKKSDYVQIPLGDIKMSQGSEKVVINVLELDGLTSYVTIGNGRGKIGKYDLSDCQIERLHQKRYVSLHVDIDHRDSACEFYDWSCSSIDQYFGSYPNSNSNCVKK